MAVDELRRKIKSHQDIANSMEEYSKQLDQTIDEVKALHYKNSNLLMQLNYQETYFKSQLKQEGANYETLKTLSDNINRLERDFAYLKHPHQLPRAYEKSLIEIQRRKKFRKLVDEESGKLKSLIKIIAQKLFLLLL